MSNYIVFFQVGFPQSSVSELFYKISVCSFNAGKLASPYLQYCWVQFTDEFIYFKWFISSFRNEAENYKQYPVIAMT